MLHKQQGAKEGKRYVRRGGKSICHYESSSVTRVNNLKLTCGICHAVTKVAKNYSAVITM